jgi:hypothetical protein
VRWKELARHFAQWLALVLAVLKLRILLPQFSLMVFVNDKFVAAINEEETEHTDVKSQRRHVHLCTLLITN